MSSVVRMMVVTVCSLVGAANTVGATLTQAPPQAPQQHYVVKSPHGDRVDPWYWLRDDSRKNPTMLAYLEAENNWYQSYASHYKDTTEQLYQEMVGRIEQDQSSVPAEKDGFLYWDAFKAGEQYPRYMRKSITTKQEEVLLDVNTLAQGHDFYQVANYRISPDGRYLAYAEDTAGRRQYTIRIKDLAKGTLLADSITNADPSIAWSADGSYLFYAPKNPQTLLASSIKRHKVGTELASDAVVYTEKDPSFYIGVSNSQDDQFVMIWAESTVSTDLHLIKADSPLAPFKPLAKRQRDFKFSAEHLGNRWIISTDWQAPNQRMMHVKDTDIGDRAKWQQLVATDPTVLIDSFAVFNDHLVINERADAVRRVRILPWNNLQAPRYITSDEAVFEAVTDTNLSQQSHVLRYSYTSLTTPQSVYEINMQTGDKTLLKQQKVPGGFDRANYKTERVWVPARDGSKIPVSLLYHKNYKKDGRAPLYQYAYGSYGSSSSPYFRSNVLSLVDRGFVYAIAHIRGGQEMGRQWYESGKLLNKMNTFTDFIDVTDYLVAQKYVANDKVFAMGGSAGGLLMGAVANMAGDKYRGIVAHVPFVDVVTTMLDESIPLTTNEFDEWGNPKQKQYYDYMLSYSPYDQVKRQAYPALLVTTGLHDSQVQYFEPAKWVAKLRTVKTDHQPLLFKINMEAGHGGKSGRFARLHETAEEYGFILSLLH